MKSFIIKKWVEPYRLLEFIKKYYNCIDLTFNGGNKISQKELFIQKLEQNKNSIGLYMKNVNKYYLFTNSELVNILELLITEFELENQDYEQSENNNLPFDLIDLGKAEASIIF